jgi:hypothetical protein
VPISLVEELSGGAIHGISTDGAYWRDRAEIARGSSEVMTDAGARRMMEGVAKTCDLLARGAERYHVRSQRRPRLAV